MTKEEGFLLEILEDYVHGKAEAEAPDGLDWNKIEILAKHHGISGIVYVQMKRAGILKHAEMFAEGFLSAVFHSVCKNEDLEELETAFNREKIPFLPMKGVILKNYWPDAELRTMGDIDIVIHPEDRQRVHQLMKEMGYQLEEKIYIPEVWSYQRDAVHYEIHDRMMYEPLANHIDYCSYFDGVWEYSEAVTGSSCYIPKAEFHFLYLVTHTAKHIIHKGSGFRPFLDMVFMARQTNDNDRNMDWSWIAKQLEALELLDFTKTCFALCERWFGVRMPFVSKELEDSFYEKITCKTFRDGIFGLENEENKMGVLAKNVRRSKLPYQVQALGAMIRKIFPAYRDMRWVPWYSFVNGRPWLLPAAWMYRFVYGIRNKGLHSQSVISELYTRREEIEARENLISDWGL